MYDWKYPYDMNGGLTLVFTDPYEWRDPRDFLITFERLMSLRGVGFTILDKDGEGLIENLA